MSTRDQIAEVIYAHDEAWNEVHDERRCECGAPTWDGIDAHRADVLALLVDSLIAESVAAELHAVADGYSDWEYGPTATLRARARAIDPTTTEKPAPCGAYSNGTDGWCCAAVGPHDEHHNAAGDVRWGAA